jgi:probable F420-dependent oxidoreductase
MRFTLMLGFSRYTDYLAMAKAADESGWTSISMPDSIFSTKQTNSKYPYADTDMIRSYIENMTFIEPVVLMSMFMAVTKRLRAFPSVLKLPIRQPLILAKQLSSLAAMSNNRISLGIGLSPWREDFAYNGMNFDKRGRLMDECMAILRGAMTGEYYEYHSENYELGPMKMNPGVTTPVPLIVGGQTRPAFQRAARLGDGWISVNTDFETLKSLIAQLNAARDEAGTRNDARFEIHGFDMAATTVEDFRRVRDLGVTDACIVPWNMMDPNVTGQQQLDAIRRFGDTVIAKFS